MKTMAIMVVCLFTFTTITWPAPFAETSTVQNALQNPVEAHTLAAQQGKISSEDFAEKAAGPRRGDIFLSIIQDELPQILPAMEGEIPPQASSISSKSGLSPLFRNILLSGLIVLSLSALTATAQSSRINVFDVKNLDASIYRELPDELNRPIEDLVRALTRDSYTSKVKNGYYSIGETKTRQEAGNKVQLQRGCIPSVNIKWESEKKNKHVLYIKYLDNKRNISWQIDYLSKHLGFSKENIIANIWKESVWEETAFSLAGAGGYLQIKVIAFKELQNRINEIEKNKKNIKKYTDAIERDKKKLADASRDEKKRLQETIKLNQQYLDDLDYKRKEVEILEHYLYAITPKNIRDTLKTYHDAPRTIVQNSYFKEQIDVPASLRNDINVHENLNRYILWSMHIGDLNIPAGVAIKALFMNDIEERIKKRQIPADTEPELAADLMYNMGSGNFDKLMEGKASFAEMIGSGLSPESRNYACKFLIMKLKIDPTYKIISNNKELDLKVKRYLITQVIFCDNSDVQLRSLKNRMRPLEKDAKNYSDMKAKKKKLQPFQQRTLDKYNQLKNEHDMIERSLHAARKEGGVDRVDRFGSDGRWDSPSSDKRKNFDWSDFANDDVKQFFIDYFADNPAAATYHGYMIQALYALEWLDQLTEGHYQELPDNQKIGVKKDRNRTWLILTFGATAMLLLAYKLKRKQGSAAGDSEEQVLVSRPGITSGKDKKPKMPASSQAKAKTSGTDYLFIYNEKNNVIILGNKAAEGIVLKPSDRAVWVSSSENVLLERSHLTAA